MRLDKYLKVSRLIKRRTIAKEVADQGRITLNGQVAKSSSAVKVGDELVIRFGNRLLTVRVTDLKENTKKEEASNLYEILGEERLNNEVRQVDEFLAENRAWLGAQLCYLEPSSQKNLENRQV